MADTIKIGSLDISSFKVGSDDCKVYLGDTLLYPQSQPQTLQWVEFNSGDTIPQSLDIYGISGTPYDFNATFGSSSAMGDFIPSRNRIEISLYCNANPCYSDQPFYNDNVEIIFSNVGCCDYYNQGATVSGTIKLYIYDSPTPPTPTSYTYSVTIQGLENGDTTTIWWDATRDIHTDSNVGNGTYTYTTTTDDIAVSLDTSGLSDYTVDYNSFMLYSGGSQTVTFTHQGGGGGLVQIPFGEDMTQYYGQSIKRLVIGDTTTTANVTITCEYFDLWTHNDYLSISQWYVSGQGQFSSINSLPIDITLTTPTTLTKWQSYLQGLSETQNPFNDLQIEWA